MKHWASKIKMHSTKYNKSQHTAISKISKPQKKLMKNLL